MRKVYLEELPKKGKFVDWKNSVGYKLPFVYEDIVGELKIIKHEINDQLTISIDGYCDDFKIKSYHLKAGKIGKALKVMTHDFRIEINTVITDNNRNLKIIDREHRKEYHQTVDRFQDVKYYKYKCEKCGNIGWQTENNLSKGTNCSVCTGRTALEGLNSIVDTHPHCVEYFKGGHEEAKLYKYGSNKKIEMICTDCKKTEEKIICEVTTNGYKCSYCGDGFSYPNKFVLNLIGQLCEKINTEMKFKWSGNKRYDIYIPYYNLIVENHGMQHYEECFEKIKNKNLQEEQENDKTKYILAKENGIENYVVLDCRKSELEWIKNSVMNSELPTLLGFKEEDIDWLKCEKYALNNLVKEVCDYKSDNPETTSKEIARKFFISKDVVVKYLKQGSKLEWCEYNPKEEQSRCLRLYFKNDYNYKKVAVFKQDVLIVVFDSIKELVLKSEELLGTKLLQSNISAVCTGSKFSYKGYRFKYIDNKGNFIEPNFKEKEPKNDKVVLFDKTTNKEIKRFTNIANMISFVDKEYGVKLDFGNVSYVLNKKRKSHKGFTFKYIDELIQ